MWCDIILSGKSFTSFSGSNIAYALLFPMETLFENYVAKMFKDYLHYSDYTVKSQDKRHHLFNEPTRKFLIKPDMVVTDKLDNSIFLFDTKWKLLNDSQPNYGMSQSDMYQMYAYQQKYNAESVTLLYPKTNNIKNDNIEFKSDDANVKVRFIDLFDENSTKLMIKSIISNRHVVFEQVET